MRKPLQPFFLLAALLVLSLCASADSKITTRNTVMGYSTEGTAYVKGARERNEMQLPGGMGKNVTILQCDQKRIINYNPQANTCMVTPLGQENAKSEAAAPEGKGGTVTFTTSTTDTGDTQKMFGYTAHRLKTTISAQASPDACAPGNVNMEVDGWYADVSPQLSCRTGALAATASARHGERRGCHDKIEMKHTGAALKGFPLKQTTAIDMGGHSMQSSSEVVDISTATLDPSLFDMPAGCKVVNSYQELMGTPRMPRMPGMPGMPGGRPPMPPPDEENK